MVALSKSFEIVRVGKPRPQPDGSWRVDSDTDTLVAYTVRQGEHGLTCTCPRYFYKFACKHIDRVLGEQGPRKPTLEDLYNF